MQECVYLVYQSLKRAKPCVQGYDSETRNPQLAQAFFELAGIPTKGIPTITITGSKGKGSTSLLSMAMLMGLGHRVGLVSSPHLVDFRERIRVDGEAIPEVDFTRIVSDLADLIRAFDRKLPPDKFLGPTGIILAIATRYFRERGVTAVVLEAGRGGRFDDNRIIENQVSCFTPIMDEHLDKLGPTRTQVAWHKTGIIKPDNTVITAPQTEEIDGLIVHEARRQSARVYRVGAELHYMQQRLSAVEQRVSVQFLPFGLSQDFTLRSAGQYQGLNLCLAYGAVTALADGQHSESQSMAAKVEQLRLPGRCEILSHRPTVILDGAINRASALEFYESVQELIRRPLILVTALPQDKDYRGFLEVLAPLCDHVIVTEVNTHILQFTKEVVEVARRWSHTVTDQPDCEAALQLAEDLAGEHGSIWVVGTQSLIRCGLLHWGQTLERVVGG